MSEMESEDCMASNDVVVVNPCASAGAAAYNEYRKALIDLTPGACGWWARFIGTEGQKPDLPTFEQLSIAEQSAWAFVGSASFNRGWDARGALVLSVDATPDEGTLVAVADIIGDVEKTDLSPAETNRVRPKTRKRKPVAKKRASKS